MAHIGFSDTAAQRREQKDRHRVERCDQRHAGYIRFTGKADHKRVRDADKHQKKLLDKKRDNQIPQFLFVNILCLVFLRKSVPAV